VHDKLARRGLRNEAGQAMAEFALLTPLFLFVIFIAITFAIIGVNALAVGQLAYNGARYVAVTHDQTVQQEQAYIKSGAIGSPTITGDSGAHLTVTVTPASGFGTPVTVTVTYDLSSNRLISMMSSLFGKLGFGASFPTTLSASESVMSEW
jgi:Flp pilus assembly protein TadG